MYRVFCLYHTGFYSAREKTYFYNFCARNVHVLEKRNEETELLYKVVLNVTFFWCIYKVSSIGNWLKQQRLVKQAIIRSLKLITERLGFTGSSEEKKERKS